LAEKERYSGEFTDECWQLWNKFALIYILLLYPVALVASILQISDPESPLGSYVAIEVIIISTYITILLLVSVFGYIGNFGPFQRIPCCQKYFTRGSGNRSAR
jgi:hypothetical protein